MKFTLVASLVAATQAVRIHQTDAQEIPQMPVLGDHEMTPEEVEGLFFTAFSIASLFMGGWAQTDQAGLAPEDFAQTWQPTLAGEDLTPEEVEGWWSSFFKGLIIIKDIFGSKKLA